MKKRDIYMINGKPAASVSQVKGILDKPWLVPWAVKLAVQYVGEKWKPEVPYTADMIMVILEHAKQQHTMRKVGAGDYGTDKHDLIAGYISGQLKPENVKDADDRTILENFIRVTDGWEWIASEIPLSNKELGYGGTADGLARDKSGMLVLPDVKTSNNVGPDVSIQLSLYALANPNDHLLQKLWEEMREIGEGRVIHLNKERLTWEVLERPLKPHYPYMPAFKQVLEWQQKFSPR